jgi:hypothetical protein
MSFGKRSSADVTLHSCFRYSDVSPEPSEQLHRRRRCHATFRERSAMLRKSFRRLATATVLASAAAIGVAQPASSTRGH